MHRLLLVNFLLFVSVYTKSLSNSSAIATTNYAKVEHWGPKTFSSENEGRSRGQKLWTHSSDVHIVKGQNLQNLEPVVYQYSSNPSDKVDAGHSEPFPGTGEVQERFNPQPYFDFKPELPKPVNSKSNSNPSENLSPPATNYGVPTFDSFPVFSKATETSSSSYDTYDPKDDFPPNNPSVSSSDNGASDGSEVSPNADNPSSYYNPSGNSKPTNDGDSGGYHFPLAPASESSLSQKPNNLYLPPDHSSNSYHKPDSYHYSQSSSYGSAMVPTAPPPDSSDDYGKQQSFSYGPQIVQTVPPPDDDNAPSDEAPKHHHHPDGALPPTAEGDLSPPPSDSNNVAYGKIPEYLDHKPQEHEYDFNNYYDHHHVYHDVTTTTEAAEEDERVNKGHYSYYYLGRKLWYIPLYFSVYFIIYITVLILKSIARHKIQLKQQWDDVRKSRELDVDQIDKIVVSSIDTAHQKYM